MSKLSRKKRKIRNQERQERRSLLERQRRKKLEYLKNTGQLEQYFTQKKEAKKDKTLKEYKPKIIETEKLTLWQKIKSFFSIIRKILRR